MPVSTILYSAWAPFFSGAERALLVLLEQLDRRRYNPVVVVGSDGELAAELRARQVDVVHVPLTYIGRRTLPQWVACVSKLVRLARRHRAAMVHANDLPSFQPAGYVARWLRLPALAHIRFVDEPEGFRWFLRPGFSKAVFVSESLKTQSTEQVPDLFANRSVAIHDGVRVDPLPGPERRAMLRHELGLPMDRTLVVLAGQISEVKGIWEFVTAAGLARQRGLPITFVVLGDDLRQNGKLRREVEAAVEAQGLSSMIRFLGFRPNAAALMPAFDIVTMPSRIEPLGLSALEGMAVQLPVVGARVGGIAETVVDGVTGRLVPCGDARALADAIEEIAADPAKARAFGTAGRQRVEAHFSVTHQALRIQDLYDEMIRGARPARLAS